MILLNSPAKPRAILFGALAGLLLTSGAPAIAQDNDEARIRKLEAEVRALQRQVFPGGDGRYFEPDISAPANGRPNTPTQTSAVTRKRVPREGGDGGDWSEEGGGAEPDSSRVAWPDSREAKRRCGSPRVVRKSILLTQRDGTPYEVTNIRGHNYKRYAYYGSTH